MSKKMVKPKISIKTKIIAGFFLATVAVAGVGWIAYNSLNVLLATLYMESLPDEKLKTLEVIMDNLTNAENSVRAYTITKDPEYLDPYYKAIANIDPRLNELESLTQGDLIQSQRIDTIEALLEKKFIILNDLIAVKNDDRVKNVLKKINENIALAEAKEENVPTIERKEPGIFERIFRNDAGQIVDNKQPNKLDAKEIREAVAEIEKEEEITSQIQADLELTYITKDKIVSDRLRELLEEMENKELILSRKRAEEASKNTAETIDVIKVICLLAFILFLLLIYVLFIDIARSNIYRKNLQKAKVKAEKLAQVKEEFMSNMSHEIRTPLNSIIGFSEQLGKTSLNYGQKDFLGIIKSSSEHLLVLINDILDYAKIETGKLSIEKIPFRPAQVLEETYQSLSNKAEEKNISFQCTINDNVPEVLLGDPVRLKQILLNLVSNAIKFTESGEVNIYSTARIKGDEQVQLYVKVKDTGIGIPDRKLYDIFKSFDQLDNSVTRKYGGTGLGLAITKKLVEIQHGAIEVKSEISKGSTFSFSIPYKKGRNDQLSHVHRKKPENYEILKGLKILVADDEEYNLLLVKSILEKWGVAVRMTHSGKEALSEIKYNDFDLILMDIQMPEMSGIETAESIRDQVKKDKAALPIIALTADSAQGEAEKCYAAGMNGFILKPFKEQELCQKIIEVKKNGTQLPEVKASDTGNNSNNDKDVDENYNLEELKTLGNGDTAFIISMLDIFIKNAASGMKAIGEGLEERNWLKVSNKAHKISPSFSHMGLKNMANSLKEIERIAIEKDKLENLPPMINKLSKNTKEILEKLEKEIDHLKEN